jgi:hypothetical protein
MDVFSRESNMMGQMSHHQLTQALELGLEVEFLSHCVDETCRHESHDPNDVVFSDKDFLFLAERELLEEE